MFRLILIFFIALFLRLIFLSSLPNGFHIDEVLTGYVGHFILVNGKDIYGNHWPLWYFNSFGDYRVIAPFYVNGLSTFLFGTTIFAVRFPSALLGALIVFPLYYIGKSLFGKTTYAYIPAFLISILPWHIILSRASSESIMGLTFITIGLACFMKHIQKSSLHWFLIGAFCVLVSYFFYPSFRIIAPLMVLPLCFISPIRKKQYVILTCVFFILTLVIGTTVWGRGRYEQTSLFSDGIVTQTVSRRTAELAAAEGNGHILAAKVFENKAVTYSHIIVTNYLTYFSPQFLWGDMKLPDRYVTPYSGLLLGIIFLLMVGLVIPIKHAPKDSWYFYFFYLLCISPIPGAPTTDDFPNLNRVMFMIMPLTILSAYGLLHWLRLFSHSAILRASFIGICIFSVIGEFTYFSHAYIVQSPSFHSELRDDGYTALVSIMKNNVQKHQLMTISSNDHVFIYYLYFTNNFSPSLANQFTTPLFIHSLPGMTFVTDGCPSLLPEKYLTTPQTHIIESGDCKLLDGYSVDSIILRRDSTRAFHVLSLKQ